MQHKFLMRDITPFDCGRKVWPVYSDHAFPFGNLVETCRSHGPEQKHQNRLFDYVVRFRFSVWAGDPG